MANLSPQKRLTLRLLLVLLLLSQPAGVVPQAPQQKPQQPPQGGVSTGGIYAPVRDALSRPITAGGFVDGAPVVFEDVTQRSGLGAFRNRTGTPEKNYILELATGGVAQAPQQKPQQPPQGGVSTGGIYAPVRDALSRPITAGGFVDGAPVVFEDVTQRSGLGAFRNRTGTPEKNYILELATGGVA